MNGNSRRERNENIQKKNAARKKKFLIGKIALICFITVAAIAVGILVKHSVNKNGISSEDSAVITASPQSEASANINLQPITSPITTTQPETTAASLTGAASGDKTVGEGLYQLKVNRQQNIVTVYTADANGEFTKAEKAMTCSVGLDDSTPTGTFTTTDKYEWRLLTGNVYGQYATRITGHILFHSVPYYTQSKSDLESAEYNKLGQAASKGCVRLSVEDAKWIYDNCKAGTTVIIYDSANEEPITPPSPIRIDLNDARKGWDPTDPDPNNPW